MKATTAGNIYVTGYVLTFPGFGQELREKNVVFKLNSNLEIIWKKLYELRPTSNGYINMPGLNIEVDEEENLYLFSSVGNEMEYIDNANIKFYTAALNANGDILWSNAEKVNDSFIDNTRSSSDNFILENRNSLYIFRKIYINKTTYSTEPSFFLLEASVINKIDGIIKKSKIFYTEAGDLANAGHHNSLLLNASIKADKIYIAFDYALNSEYKKYIGYLTLDTNLNSMHEKRIVSTYSPFAALKLSSDGTLTIAYQDSLYYVYNNATQLITKGNIGNNIHPNNVIKNILFFNNDSALLSNVTFNYLGTQISKGITLLQTPIYQAINNPTCFGGNTPNLVVDTVAFKTKDGTNDLTWNVLISSTSTATQADFHPLQTIYCKQVSVCDVIKISGKTKICVGEAVTFKVTKDTNCFKNIKWKLANAPVTIIDSTENNLTVKFTENWSGYIFTDLENCSLSDSIWGDALKSVSQFSLGNDKVICEGDEIILKPVEQTPTILWQNGEITDSLIVKKEGSYTASATDYCNNTFYDTVIVTKALMPTVTALPKNVALCKGLNYSFNVSSAFVSYNWQPDYNITSTTSATVKVNPEITTQYFLKALTSNGCEYKDSVLVTVNTCTISYYFPNAFSPNNDGINDFFKPIVYGPIEEYEFIIYNRWGNVVFKTNNTTLSWDGKVGGKTQPTGNYIWTCRLKYVQQEVITKKGSLMLIR